MLCHRRDRITALGEVNLEDGFLAYGFAASALVEQAAVGAPDRATGGGPALDQLPVAQRLPPIPGSSVSNIVVAVMHGSRKQSDVSIWPTAGPGVRRQYASPAG
jgi:hypothetical protein